MTQYQDIVVSGEEEGIIHMNKVICLSNMFQAPLISEEKYFSPSIPLTSVGQNQSSASIDVLLKIQIKEKKNKKIRHC